MIRLIKFILLILFLILSFQKLLIANNNSSLVDKISKNLRCLICQGQSVYDSQSDFALSMKILINNKIKEITLGIAKANGGTISVEKAREVVKNATSN